MESATNYDELKDAIARAYPDMSQAAAAHRPLRAGETRRPGAGHRGRRRRSDRGAALGHDPLCQRAGLSAVSRTCSRCFAAIWWSARPATASASTNCAASSSTASARRPACCTSWWATRVAELGHLEEIDPRGRPQGGGEADRRCRPHPCAGPATRLPGRQLPGLRAGPARTARPICSTAPAACCARTCAPSTADDVLLVASFRSYSPEVVEAAQLAAATAACR